MYTQSTNEVFNMLNIDPIISTISMAAVSGAIAFMSSLGVGIAVFFFLFLAGVAGDKIMGNLPTE